ncbi:MAG: hypothetical protein ACKV2U_32310, partial [Bryobacteraceae bacterium]
MRRSLALLFSLTAIYILPAQPPSKDEPAKQEIIDAYHSKSGGAFGLGQQWERWRIKEVRGRALRFKKISEKSTPGGIRPGLLTRQYRVQAKKNNWCSEYRLT